MDADGDGGNEINGLSEHYNARAIRQQSR